MITSAILYNYRFAPNFACGWGMWSVQRLLFETNRKYISDFRGVQIPILAFSRLLLPRFQRIVTKIRTELKLMSVDFVLGGLGNRKWNYNFTEVQNLTSVSISLVIERLRTQFSTGFHNILRTARKRGRLGSYCFLDKSQIGSRCLIFEVCGL